MKLLDLYPFILCAKKGNIAFDLAVMGSTLILHYFSSVYFVFSTYFLFPSLFSV